MSRSPGLRSRPRRGMALPLLAALLFAAGLVGCASGGEEEVGDPRVARGETGAPEDGAGDAEPAPAARTPDLDSLRAAGPMDTPYDEGPVIVQGDWLPRLLERRLLPVIEAEDLPPSIGTRLWLLVAADGRVIDAVLHTRSGSEAFDAEARETALELQYHPATRDGRRVPVWILARISLLLR